MLRTKMAIGSDHVSMEMLSDPTYIEEPQKSALSSFDQMRGRCHTAGNEYRMKTLPPSVRMLADEQYADGTIVANELYMGRLTWGQFNTRVRDLNEDYRRRFAQADAEMQSAAAAERQRQGAFVSEYIQRQQMIQSMQQPVYVPAPMPISRPVQTNCTRFGNQVSCTSY